MPHFFKTGSIVSNNIILYRKKTPKARKNKNYGIVKARVDEVLYTDDPRNSTYNTNNKSVEYNCTILGGIEAGKRIFNVIDATALGGQNNKSEVIRMGMINEDVSGSQEKSPDQTGGEIVLLARLQGSNDAGVIVGSLKHPKSSSGATKSDGQRTSWEYNGFSFSIDKDGALTATYGGGIKDSSGNAANSSAAGAKITFDKTGGISFVDKDQNGISIDGSNKKVTLKGGTGGMDISSGGGWNIQVSGSAAINAGGTLDLNGAIINLAGGGMQCARMNDLVFGTDSQGGPINAYIGIGSSVVLVGG